MLHRKEQPGPHPLSDRQQPALRRSEMDLRGGAAAERGRGCSCIRRQKHLHGVLWREQMGRDRLAQAEQQIP